jgi:carbamoyl-phosphate synthase large subunit
MIVVVVVARTWLDWRDTKKKLPYRRFNQRNERVPFPHCRVLDYMLNRDDRRLPGELYRGGPIRAAISGEQKREAQFNSRQPINVLVLGVGGNVSQGILKALAMSKLRCRVIGACISPLSFGLYTVDTAYVSPNANDPSFFGWLVGVCRTEHIHAILSGAEPVIAVLARAAERIRAETGAICIVSSPERLAIGDDKLLTCQWLRDQGLSFPRFVALEDTEGAKALITECGYPLIAKPRSGKGACGVFEVRSEEEFQSISGRKAFIIQEYLGDPSQEYTAGCFSDRDGTVRGAIVLRRDLIEGTTCRAVAGHFPNVREEAIRIVEALRPMGPCNVQMRMHHGVPVCFDINTRFSGTTPIRAHFGFNDVEAAINHYVLGQPAADLPLITQGVALRYWNEAYLDPEAMTELEESSRLERRARYQTIIEKFGMRQ